MRPTPEELQVGTDVAKKRTRDKHPTDQMTLQAAIVLRLDAVILLLEELLSPPMIVNIADIPLCARDAKPGGVTFRDDDTQP